MNITFVTSAETDEEGYALLKEFAIFLSTGTCIVEEYWNCDFNAGAIRSAYSFFRLAVLLITKSPY